MPLCHSSQPRVHHTRLSWAGNGLPFWRYALLSVAVTSATWPQCWGFLPDQGPQHWRHSSSSECWGWCKDSSNGSAQGIVDGGSRLPITQSHPAGWCVQLLDRHWSYCLSLDACCSILFCKVCQKSYIDNEAQKNPKMKIGNVWVTLSIKCFPQWKKKIILIIIIARGIFLGSCQR